MKNTNKQGRDDKQVGVGLASYPLAPRNQCVCITEATLMAVPSMGVSRLFWSQTNEAGLRGASRSGKCQASWGMCEPGLPGQTRCLESRHSDSHEGAQGPRHDNAAGQHLPPLVPEAQASGLPDPRSNDTSRCSQ